MTPVDPGADPIEALREAVERIAAEPCAYLSDMDDLTCADGEWDEPCPACIARDALAAPAEERFPNGYPEDPVLGPYEDDADEDPTLVPVSPSVDPEEGP